MIAHVVAAAAIGRRLTPRQAWAATRGKRWRLVGLTALLGLTLDPAHRPLRAELDPGRPAGRRLAGADRSTGSSACPLFVAFVVWFWVRIYYLPVPALMLEPVGVFGAIGRGYHLTRGRLLAHLRDRAAHLGHRPGAGIDARPAVSFISQAALLGGVPSEAGLLVLVLGQALASVITAAFVAPFTTAVATLQYLDLRMRTEAYDVDAHAAGRDHRRVTAAGCRADPPLVPIAGRGALAAAPRAAASPTTTRTTSSAGCSTGCERLIVRTPRRGLVRSAALHVRRDARRPAARARPRVAGDPHPRASRGRRGSGAGAVSRTTSVSARRVARPRRGGALRRGPHSDALVDGFRALAARQVERGLLDDAPGRRPTSWRAPCASAYPDRGAARRRGRPALRPRAVRRPRGHRGRRRDRVLALDDELAGGPDERLAASADRTAGAASVARHAGRPAGRGAARRPATATARRPRPGEPRRARRPGAGAGAGRRGRRGRDRPLGRRARGRGGRRGHHRAGHLARQPRPEHRRPPRWRTPACGDRGGRRRRVPGRSRRWASRSTAPTARPGRPAGAGCTDAGLEALSRPRGRGRPRPPVRHHRRLLPASDGWWLASAGDGLVLLGAAGHPGERPGPARRQRRRRAAAARPATTGSSGTSRAWTTSSATTASACASCCPPGCCRRCGCCGLAMVAVMLVARSPARRAGDRAAAGHGAGAGDDRGARSALPRRRGPRARRATRCAARPGRRWPPTCGCPPQRHRRARAGRRPRLGRPADGGRRPARRHRAPARAPTTNSSAWPPRWPSSTERYAAT